MVQNKDNLDLVRIELVYCSTVMHNPEIFLKTYLAKSFTFKIQLYNVQVTFFIMFIVL